MEELIRETTVELLTKLHISYQKIDISFEDNDITRVNILSEEDTGLLIGFHGETLNSLQHILKSIIWTDRREQPCFLIVDADNYKKRQEENILGLAKRKADQVKEFKNPQILPPMSAYHRKLIHLHLASNEDYSAITTESIGEGDHRQIKIIVKEEV